MREVAEGVLTKVDDEKRLVFGWANIIKDEDGQLLLDRQDDYIDSEEELEKAAYQYVLNSRDGGEMHIRKGVSTMVESVVLTKEKQEALGIPEGVVPTGWWIGFRVNDERVWDQVKKGEYVGFSVHGTGKRERTTLEAGEYTEVGKADRFDEETEEALREHGANHTGKHMRRMRELMAQGMSMDEAHEAATKEVGKSDCGCGGGDPEPEPTLAIATSVFEVMAKAQSARNSKVSQVMEEFEEGKLKSSSGKKVTSRKQALAIALSEAGRGREVDKGDFPGHPFRGNQYVSAEGRATGRRRRPRPTPSADRPEVPSRDAMRRATRALAQPGGGRRGTDRADRAKAREQARKVLRQDFLARGARPKDVDRKVAERETKIRRRAARNIREEHLRRNLVQGQGGYLMDRDKAMMLREFGMGEGILRDRPKGDRTGVAARRAAAANRAAEQRRRRRSKLRPEARGQKSDKMLTGNAPLKGGALKDALIGKGGPGSGEPVGHPFRGNQYTGGVKGRGRSGSKGQQKLPLKGAKGGSAIDALKGSKKLRLGVKEVDDFMDRLRKELAGYSKSEVDAMNINLCQISVPGTNLFCGDNKGVPRKQMPQLGGKPREGSDADNLPKDDKGEVSGEQAFLDHLKSQGVMVSDKTMKASELKASQTELVGAKVAGMAGNRNFDRRAKRSSCLVMATSLMATTAGRRRLLVTLMTASWATAP